MIAAHRSPPTERGSPGGVKIRAGNVAGRETPVYLVGKSGFFDSSIRARGLRYRLPRPTSSRPIREQRKRGYSCIFSSLLSFRISIGLRLAAVPRSPSSA